MHGETHTMDLPMWLGPDPDLAMVEADMRAWEEAHPCECDALCVCEEGT